jgi:D-glycero-alpha-D-manno-heptose-7-phosphate kinase
MIITKTPYRVSLFGGGTDHPAWFTDNGGEVISFTIDKFCYISVRVLPPFFNHKFRIVYSKVETVSDFNQISHPVVREAIRKYTPNLHLEIHHDGDLPARSGIGSSSAFVVGLIHALKVLQNNRCTSEQLANEAIQLEKEDLRESVGYQDQIACSLGGMNYLKFSGRSNWQATPITLDQVFQEKFMQRIVLIYTGVSRKSSDIQKKLLLNIRSKHSTMNRVIELSRQCKQIIECQGDLDLIGEMLDESWNLKREMNSDAVTPELDSIWLKAKQSGAIGGKVLGAGGGGFCMFWVKNGQRESFLRNFNFGLYVPINISANGSICILK